MTKNLYFDQELKFCQKSTFLSEIKMSIFDRISILDQNKNYQEK